MPNLALLQQRQQAERLQQQQLQQHLQQQHLLNACKQNGTPAVSSSPSANSIRAFLVQQMKVQEHQRQQQQRQQKPLLPGYMTAQQVLQQHVANAGLPGGMLQQQGMSVQAQVNKGGMPGSSNQLSPSMMQLHAALQQQRNPPVQPYSGGQHAGQLLNSYPVQSRMHQQPVPYSMEPQGEFSAPFQRMVRSKAALSIAALCSVTTLFRTALATGRLSGQDRVCFND